jgi:hypothetical protein
VARAADWGRAGATRGGERARQVLEGVLSEIRAVDETKEQACAVLGEHCWMAAISRMPRHR